MAIKFESRRYALHYVQVLGDHRERIELVYTSKRAREMARRITLTWYVTVDYVETFDYVRDLTRATDGPRCNVKAWGRHADPSRRKFTRLTV